MDKLGVKTKIDDFFFRCTKHSNIDPDEPFFEMGFINSLFVMQLIMFIEKEFGIDVSNDDLLSSSLQTINGACEYIIRKVS